MVIYGVALLAGCMLVGAVIGELIGLLIGIDAVKKALDHMIKLESQATALS